MIVEGTGNSTIRSKTRPHEIGEFRYGLDVA